MRTAFPAPAPPGTALPAAPSEALVVLVGAARYAVPVDTLAAVLRRLAATPTVLADVRVPLWWHFGLAAGAELGVPVSQVELSEGIEETIRAAVAACPALDGTPIESTAWPLPDEVARMLARRRFAHLVLLAPRHSRRVVRRVLRRVASDTPAEVHWLR
jgi:hypothetical protein